MGAQHAEQGRIGDCATANEDWMMREFAIQLQSMGITSWHECQFYLRGFLFSPGLEPLPSPGWFERLQKEGETQGKPKDGPLTIRNWVNMGLEGIWMIETKS